MMTDEKRKELLAKRKYYSEHPEEARKAYLKRRDDVGLIAVEPKKNDKQGC